MEKEKNLLLAVDPEMNSRMVNIPMSTAITHKQLKAEGVNWSLQKTTGKYWAIVTSEEQSAEADAEVSVTFYRSRHG